MHIVFIVLRFIGWLLLFIAALLLCLLLIVLFVPIRYRFFGERKPEETGDMALRMEASATWLLHLLRIDASMRGRACEVKLKVLGFTVKSLKETVPEAKSGESEARENVLYENEAQESESQERESKEAEPQETRSEETRSEKTQDRETQQAKMSPGEEAAREETAEENTPRRLTLRERAGAFFRSLLKWMQDIPRRGGDLIFRLYELFDAGEDAVDHFLGRIEDLKDRLDPYLSDTSRAWYGKVLRRAVKLLKACRPRRIAGDMTLGTGSPDTTAVAVGALEAYLPKASKDLTLRPEFYQRALEGDITVKGHVRLVHALWALILLLLDKHTRYMLHLIRK